jgi:hypothetical protein
MYSLKAACQHPVVCSAWENLKPGHREHTYFGLPTSAAVIWIIFDRISQTLFLLPAMCRYFVTVLDLLAHRAFTVIGTVVLIISGMFVFSQLAR